MSNDTMIRTSRATNAAEGMMRRRWTLDDVERMVAAGMFDEFDRLELIGGELVPMSPKGNHHENLRNALSTLLARLTPRSIGCGFEPQFNLADDEFRNPDIMLFPQSIRIHDVRGPDALLVIEIADTSLDYDSGGKAETYARFGVRDYWVVNARNRETTIFRSPKPKARKYTDMTVVPAEETLQALLVPEISVRLADID